MKKCSILWILFISACTPTSPLITARWSGSGKKPILELNETTLENKSSWSSANENVEFAEQKVSNYRIDGSFVKTVSSKNKKPLFQSYSIVNDITPFKILHADKMEKSIEKNWLRFVNRNSTLKIPTNKTPIQVVFATTPRLNPVYRTTFETSLGEIQSLTYDDNGTLISNERVGSNLTDMVDSPALAFPKGPKKSELTPVMLTRKMQPEGLANSLIEMSSISPNKIISSSNLQFQPTDDRFDQVQAFYFSQKILQWFEQTLLLKGPYKLSIVTQLGFPEKTNAAFYYQNQIRLGAGDDVTFSNMSWDPTIVMHETSHAVIDALSRLPFQGQGGSINEGYADTFTTFYLESPLLGDNSYRLGPFKRTVDLPLKLSEANGGLYHDSAIVSGFFWSLKKLIGPDHSLSLAIHVLNRLGPNTNFADFKLALNEQTNELFKDEELKTVKQLLQDRELL